MICLKWLSETTQTIRDPDHVRTICPNTVAGRLRTCGWQKIRRNRIGVIRVSVVE